MQFDTGWYVYIAEHGYDKHAESTRSTPATSRRSRTSRPTRSTCVRSRVLTGDDYVRAADAHHRSRAVSRSLLLFWAWCGRRLSTGWRGDRRSCCCSLYPYAWFLYGSGYGDAFFIARHRSARSCCSSAIGPCSPASPVRSPRPRDSTGIAVLIGLVAARARASRRARRSAVELRRRSADRGQGWHLRSRRGSGSRDAGVLSASRASWSYCVYFCVTQSATPFAFNTVQSAPGWNQGTGRKPGSSIVLRPRAARLARVLRHPTRHPGACSRSRSSIAVRCSCSGASGGATPCTPFVIVGIPALGTGRLPGHRSLPARRVPGVRRRRGLAGSPERRSAATAVLVLAAALSLVVLASLLRPRLLPHLTGTCGAAR